MSVEDEHSEVVKKYTNLKKRDGVPHSDLAQLDEMFEEWDVAFNNDEPTDRLRDMLGEIESIIDDIFICLYDYDE